MKVQIIETKESDGDWIKVKVDDSTKACFILAGMRTREEIMARADEIAQFYWENGGNEKILKEFTSGEQLTETDEDDRKLFTPEEVADHFIKNQK